MPSSEQKRWALEKAIEIAKDYGNSGTTKGCVPEKIIQQCYERIIAILDQINKRGL